MLQLENTLEIPVKPDYRRSGPQQTPKAKGRSPIWLILAAVVLVGAALAAVITWNTKTQTVSTVTSASDLVAGHKLRNDDLKVVQTQGLKVYLSDTQDLVGKTLTRPLSEGEVVVERDITSGFTIPDGYVVIGLNLTASQVPGNDLVVGDVVSIYKAKPNDSLRLLAKRATVSGLAWQERGSSTLVSLAIEKQESEWVLGGLDEPEHLRVVLEN